MAKNLTKISKPAVPTLTDVQKPFSGKFGLYKYAKFGQARFGGKGVDPIPKPAMQLSARADTALSDLAQADNSSGVSKIPRPA